MNDGDAINVPQRPAGPPSIFMRWASLSFIHWRVPAAALRPLIPDGLEIDTFDGSAWVGLVPFTMTGVRPRRWPATWRIRGVTDFHECNVRTYVTRDGECGVWFFSLDAASRLAVRIARRMWNLAYHRATIELEDRGEEVSYAVCRQSDGIARRSGVHDSTPALRCRWTLGERMPQSQPGSLEHFLTERYMLYAADRRGTVFRGRIWHEPWPLRRASLASVDDSLVAAAGIDVSAAGKPVVFAADPIEVAAWRIQRVEERLTR